MKKSEIERKCVGNQFKIIGDHPHKDKTVRGVSFNKIKGCAKPGLLVIDNKGAKFRVFDLEKLESII